MCTFNFVARRTRLIRCGRLPMGVEADKAHQNKDKQDCGPFDQISHCLFFLRNKTISRKPFVLYNVYDSTELGTLPFFFDVIRYPISQGHYRECRIKAAIGHMQTSISDKQIVDLVNLAISVND